MRKIYKQQKSVLVVLRKQLRHEISFKAFTLRTLTIRPCHFRLLEFEKEIEGVSKVDWARQYIMQDLPKV